MSGMFGKAVAVGGLLCALAAPAASRAQTVNGFVVAEGTEERVQGAMVVLTDSLGAVVDRTLTDARGAFALDADAPGFHALRIDRIGYDRHSTDRFPVPDEGVFRRVAVMEVPIRLEGIEVTGARRCVVRPETARTTAIVWEEVRKALVAARWTAENSIYRYTLLNYRHITEADGERILEEERSFDLSRDVTAYRSKPIEELVAEGFVQPDGEGGTVYYAPDAEGFLSDEFLGTHCFEVRQGEDGEIGLSFAPLGARLPDIEGVMWLDGPTAVLRRLEFTYVNLSLPDNLPATGPPTGVITFVAMPNGTWIVADWIIDMPQYMLPGPESPRLRVFRRKRGGIAWRATDREGMIVLESATATVAGRVTFDAGRTNDRSATSEDAAPPADSAGDPAGEPIEGAYPPYRPGPGHVAAFAGDTTPAAHTVRIVGTGETASVAMDGGFILPGLAGGLQHVEVRHPLLDTMGFRAPATPFEVELGEVANLDLEAPILAESLHDACYPAGGVPHRPPLLARVFDRSGPAELAEVLIAWSGDVDWPEAERSEATLLAMPEPSPYAEVEAGRLEWAMSQDSGTTVLSVSTDSRGMVLLCEPPYEAAPSIAIAAGRESLARDLPPSPQGAPAVVLVYNLTSG